MKINFKKIATVLGSALMIGSTMGLAAAATTYPAPFVQGGSGDVAIVVGSQAEDLDMAQATSIATSLSAKITTGALTGEATTLTGNTAKLERGRDKFNLINDLNDHYSSLDEDQFSSVLAQGTYLNDDNNEYKYDQKIEMSSEAIQFFKNSAFNDDKPIIGFSFDKGDLVLNYTLTFTTSAEGGAAVSSDEYPKLDNTNINFLGKTWFISDAEYTTTNGIQLTLLDSANTDTIKDGDSKSMTIGGKTYTVSVDSFSGDASAGKVKLIVNGQTTNALSAGQTYKLSDGTYVGVKEISMRDVAGTIASAEFSIGAGKLVLEQGQEVKINDEALSTFEDANEYSSMIKTYFTNSSATSIDKMVLEWKTNSRVFIAPGTELTMPGFNAIKLSMASWNTPSPEKITIEDDADSVRISAPIKDGDLSINILYANSSITGFDGLGADSTTKLVTNSTVDPTFALNESENSYFVATWISGKEAESYAYEISSIAPESGKNKTTLRSLVSGVSDLVFGQVGDSKDVGQLTFTLVSANDVDEVASVTVTGTEAYGNLLATKNGAVLKLPVLTNAANYTDVPLNDGEFPSNASAPGFDRTSFSMNVSEADKDGTIRAGGSFTVQLGLSAGEGTQVTGTSLTEIREERSSDYYLAYVNSDLATKVRLYNPSGSSSLDTLEIDYPASESYADVYLAEASATTTSGSGSATIQPVLDSAIDTVKTKNLIVVGGSCVNTVAARLLGLGNPTSIESCKAAFTTATQVGSGQFLIQAFDAANAGGTAGKVALLVAGYEKEDTQKAASYLVNKVVDTTAGKKYRITSSTEAIVA